MLAISGRGGKAQRAIVVDALSEQLGFDCSSFGVPEYQFFSAVAAGMDALLAASWSWATDDGRHQSLVREGASILTVDGLISVLARLGCRTFQPALRIERLADIDELLREKLVNVVAGRAHKTLVRWSDHNAWHPDTALGIVLPPKRDPGK